MGCSVVILLAKIRLKRERERDWSTPPPWMDLVEVVIN